ncbi:protein HGH1 homolog, partial [Callorhinchus milii]|uniref:protein HGH1 homolog n=1 Tax=Callorhinchus milii TaxID=7868 RepID=UPI001C3F9C58
PHSWLLSDQVDLLPFLLLPLAGPEELSEDEMEGLPVDLQYLPEDKQREKDPDIRKMLIEAINLLTATKSGREQVRERNAYVVVRELHKWEPEPDVQAACEKLVQVLISDEPEEGMENLLEVEVPEEIDEKLRQQDEEEQRLIEKEREELLKKEEEKENGERAREKGQQDWGDNAVLCWAERLYQAMTLLIPLMSGLSLAQLVVLLSLGLKSCAFKPHASS